MPSAQSRAVDPAVYTAERLKEGKEILTRYQTSGEYKSGLFTLKRKFLEWGVLWKERIHCDHVGVDEENRAGMGVAAADAQTHGQEIMSLGFSWDETRGLAQAGAARSKSLGLPAAGQ